MRQCLTAAATGNLEPMSPEQLERLFLSLAEPLAGSASRRELSPARLVPFASVRNRRGRSRWRWMVRCCS
jgi:hypothetical protein